MDPAETTTEQPYHALDPSDAVRRVAVDPLRGLSPDEVARRRDLHGENRLVGDVSPGPLTLLARQFTDLMIIVLLIASAVAGLIGEVMDSVAILVIVALNGVIGFFQEYRAERALLALQQLSAPHVQVVRDGQVRRVAEPELVSGDVVLLEAGNVVPADLRVIETADLTIDEAALTGESVPVVKDAEAGLSADTPLDARVTMAHKGTLVTRGRARCVTVAIGAETELGHIASLVRGRARPMTPLQKRLAKFGRGLSAAVLAICAVVFAFGLLRGEAPMLMFLTAVALAVAAIPEALPAVVTVALGLGTKRMAQRNTLVRRLPAVEALGSVTTICCDKTGTLTQNSMRAEHLFTPAGAADALPPADRTDGHWQTLGRAMALNNDAEAGIDGKVKGDPTEAAIFEAARDAGFLRETLSMDWPRAAEIAFDARRRRMTTLHQGPEAVLAVVKGAPEAVIDLCRNQLGVDGVEPLDRDGFTDTVEKAAQSGYRLLAFAERTLKALPRSPVVDEVECDLTLLGLVALADPPRPGVAEALAFCETAGISVSMITGDHPATANAIARRLGIVKGSDRPVTGAELQNLTPEEFAEAVSEIRVYARVSPEQKLNIVTALQRRGQIVAMTGDGVNDAPALKQADIGVAMGLKGTDVARQAADAVLLDDDFSTIVEAVREGRRIYDNLRKFIKYTMTSNSGEIWTIFLAPFLGLPLPLLPIQILWINLVTDGLPGLALGVEGEERNIMERPPRPPKESVFARGMWQHMIWVGLLIGGLSLGAQSWAYHTGSENWQTVVFTVLTLSQLVHAMAVRSEHESLFTLGWFSNPALFGAVILTLGLQLTVIYFDPLHAVFKTSDLTFDELLVALSLPWVVLVAVEIEKWLVRRGMIYQN